MIDTIPNSSNAEKSDFSSPSNYYYDYSNPQYYSNSAINGSYTSTEQGYSVPTSSAYTNQNQLQHQYGGVETSSYNYYNYSNSNYFYPEQSYFGQDYYSNAVTSSSTIGVHNYPPQQLVGVQTTSSPSSSSASSSSASPILSPETSTSAASSSIAEFVPPTRAKCSKKKPNKEVVITSGLDLSSAKVANEPSSVSIKLTNNSLWERFNRHTTEMIITKQGR